MAARIDGEVRRLLDEAHAEAREILTLHRATLDLLATALVEHETLGDTQLAAIFGELDEWVGGADSEPDADEAAQQLDRSRVLRRFSAGASAGSVPSSSSGSVAEARGDRDTPDGRPPGFGDR
jgi:cell division protease FtsH